MNLKSKKGYALVLAILFMIISAITSVGLYTYAYHVSKQIAIEEPVHNRKYYASIGATRYAYILLENPKVNLGPAAQYVTSGGITTDEHDGENVVLSITPSIAGIGADLNLIGNDSITITILEYNDPVSTPWSENNYMVETTFL